MIDTFIYFEIFQVPRAYQDLNTAQDPIQELTNELAVSLV